MKALRLTDWKTDPELVEVPKPGRQHNGQVVGIVTASDITQLIDVRALAQPSVSRR
jgi:hypothetical protein